MTQKRLLFTGILALFLLITGCAERDKTYAKVPMGITWLKGEFMRMNADGSTNILKDIDALFREKLLVDQPLKFATKPDAIVDLDLHSRRLIRMREKSRITIQKNTATYSGRHSYLKLRLESGRIILAHSGRSDDLTEIDVWEFRLVGENFCGVIEKKRNKLLVLCSEGRIKLLYNDKLDHHMTIYAGEKIWVDHGVVLGKKFPLTCDDLVAMEEFRTIRSEQRSVLANIDYDNTFRRAFSLYRENRRQEALSLYETVIDSPLYLHRYPEKYYISARLYHYFRGEEDAAHYYYLTSLFSDEEPYASESCLGLYELYLAHGDHRLAQNMLHYILNNFPGSRASLKAGRLLRKSA